MKKLAEYEPPKLVDLASADWDVGLGDGVSCIPGPTPVNSGSGKPTGCQTGGTPSNT